MKVSDFIGQTITEIFTDGQGGAIRVSNGATILVEDFRRFFDKTGEYADDDIEQISMPKFFDKIESNA